MQHQRSFVMQRVWLIDLKSRMSSEMVKMKVEYKLYHENVWPYWAKPVILWRSPCYVLRGQKQWTVDVIHSFCKVWLMKEHRRSWGIIVNGNYYLNPLPCQHEYRYWQESSCWIDNLRILSCWSLFLLEIFSLCFFFWDYIKFTNRVI